VTKANDGATVSEPNPAPLGPDAAPGADAIRAQLDRVLASAQFANAPSMRRMLRFVVEHALAGSADRLKEYTLGVEVFGRGGDFDPRQDTIVRVQARRLRERLVDYYDMAGSADALRIGLPTGHYVPTFDWAPAVPVAAEPADPPGPRPPPDAPRPSARRRLAWLVPVLLLAAVATLALVSWQRRATQAAVPLAGHVPVRIAVLPFADLSQAKDQEYLADGLAEEILNQLAQVPALRVIGRASSFSFKGKDEDLGAIARQLGVSHLVQGSVRRDGDQLRITTQLVRADDGTHLWSRTYARRMRDVFAVQDVIARDVAQALSVKLDVVAFNREQGGTTNVDAYERFLRWRSSVMRELFDFEHDRERLQLAREMVALDPNCVLCWDALGKSLLAMSHELGGTQGERLGAEARQVRQHIARMAPDSWLVKRDRANALWRLGRRAEALAVARQVVDSGPLTWERAGTYAFMLFALGRLDETVALVEQVRAIEPRALFLSRDLQFDYVAARRFEDAESEYQRGRTMEGSQAGPDFVAFSRQLAGKRPGGVAALRELHGRLLRNSRRYDTQSFRDLGKVLDDREAMLAVTRNALADAAYGGELLDVWASVADALGDADLAVAALRKELDATEGFRTGSMSQYPYSVLWVVPYSGVRSHPEFGALLRQAGVLAAWRQSGKWGDGCTPLGDSDFQCK
jgi:TolB-like protein